jgi:predicted nucleic acid-binding protein
VSSAVADAGPLIHLAEIGCLPLLRLFDIIHIPDAVWSESVRPDRVREGDLLAFGAIRRYALISADVTRFAAENNLTHLQAGESEALCLSRQINVETLLTDDLAVRDEARRLGIVPVGSLGVIVGACHEGYVTLTEAERYLAALYSVSSLFVTRTIVELAIERLRQGDR